MGQALFKAVFVTIFVVGLISLLKGEFQGWGMVLGWFVGTLLAEITVQWWKRKGQFPA